MVIKTRNLLAGDKRLVSVGPHTYGPLEIQGAGRVIIGDYCSIAANVRIMLADHHAEWISTYPFSANELLDEWPSARGIGGYPFHKGDVVIENDVWIGRGSTILSGVRIGDGAVIAACSVVPGDVPPYSIVAGNPAKVVKYRFPKEDIEFLLRLKWWAWSESDISSCVHLLCSGSVNALREFARIKEGGRG